MKALVLYDSNFGNTKLIADAIADAIGAERAHISDVNPDSLSSYELLVVGSPINGWRPTEKTGKFLLKLEHASLTGVMAAAFDTRIKVWYSGDAAKQIAGLLKGAGAALITSPEPFYVVDKEGPLVEGELERAREWARGLVSQDNT